MQRDNPENPICIGLLMLLGQSVSDDSEIILRVTESYVWL